MKFFMNGRLLPFEEAVKEDGVCLAVAGAYRMSGGRLEVLTMETLEDELCRLSQAVGLGEAEEAGFKVGGTIAE